MFNFERCQQQLEARKQDITSLFPSCSPLSAHPGVTEPFLHHKQLKKLIRNALLWDYYMEMG